MDDLEKTVPLKPIKPKEAGAKPAVAASADLAQTVPLKPIPELAAAMPAPKRETPPQKPQAAALKPETVTSKPETVTFKPETAADAWLGLLATRGVEYLFANGGTDFAPVVEAYAKGQSLGWRR